MRARSHEECWAATRAEQQFFHSSDSNSKAQVFLILARCRTKRRAAGANIGPFQSGDHGQPLCGFLSFPFSLSSRALLSSPAPIIFTTAFSHSSNRGASAMCMCILRIMDNFFVLAVGAALQTSVSYILLDEIVVLLPVSVTSLRSPSETWHFEVYLI